MDISYIIVFGLYVVFLAWTSWKSSQQVESLSDFTTGGHRMGLLLGIGVNHAASRSPLLKTDVDQVASAHNFDDVERRLRCHQQGADAGASNQQHQQQAQLQTQNRRTGLAHPVGQAVAHRQHCPRAWRHRNDAGRDEIRHPSVQIHA